MASQQRNKTLKRPHDDGTIPVNASDTLRDFLDAEAENAYNRPWHRLERGFRLNRLRKFAEAEAIKTQLSPAEVQQLQLVLTKALDRRLLNTKTTVIYEQESGEINENPGVPTVTRGGYRSMRRTRKARKIKRTRNVKKQSKSRRR